MKRRERDEQVRAALRHAKSMVRVSFDDSSGAQLV